MTDSGVRVHFQIVRWQHHFAPSAATATPATCPRPLDVSTGGRTACFLHPVDGQTFEEGGEAAAQLGPRDANLLDAVRRALATRHVGGQDGFELAGVEVAPASGLGVVARRRLTTLRTKKLCPGGVFQMAESPHKEGVW